jgi:hypothetical protein
MRGFAESIGRFCRTGAERFLPLAKLTSRPQRIASSTNDRRTRGAKTCAGVVVVIRRLWRTPFVYSPNAYPSIAAPEA